MLSSLLKPLILFLEYILVGFASLTGSYGLAILLLSCITSTLLMLLNLAFRIFPQREQTLRRIIDPQIQKIRKENQGSAAHVRIQKLYRRYRYHPILTLRSALPLFIQLPFLISAYIMIGNLKALAGMPLLFIQDLSQPDHLLWGLNFLPLLMTLINVLGTLLSPGLKAGNKLQAFIIAALFLVLLYNAPSALLLYWTMNNLIFLIKTVAFRAKNPAPSTPKPAKTFHIFRKELSSRLDLGLRQYVTMLVLYYFYQVVFNDNLIILNRMFKYAPFAFASYLLWIMQVKALLKSYSPSLKHNLALVLTAMVVMLILLIGINLAAPLIIIDYQAANFFSFMAWLLGITALGIGGLITEPATEENTSSSLYHKLLPCTLALIPALHFAQVNPEYLKGIYHLAYIFFIVTFATLNKFLLKAFSGTRLSSRRLSLNASVFTFSILFLPLLRAVMKVRNDGDFDFWILCLVLLLVSGLVRTKKAFQRLFQIVLITLLVFFLAYLGSFLKGYRQSNRKIKVIPSELQNLSFTTSPNIYIFVYDGIPNQRVFKAQNLPFSDLEGILRHYAFKLYEDTYTLGEMSMDSMGNMLDFTDQLRAKAGKASSQAQDTYTGNSITNLLLRSIGYRSHFLLDNYYTGMHSVLNRDLATEIYPIRELSEVGFHFLKVLLSGIFQGEMALETKDIINSEGYMGFAIQNRKLALIKEANDKTLVVNHFFLPGHSQNTGFCRPNETQLWIERLAEALIQMEKDFSAIQAHDPNAIVIAIGDHGPSLTGDCFRLAAWKKEDITPDLIWDRIGTMVAIRWPDPQKAERFDAQLVTNQDIIPILLAYLSESNLPLKYCPGDVFYGFKTPLRSAIGFDKGTILR